MTSRLTGIPWRHARPDRRPVPRSCCSPRLRPWPTTDGSAAPERADRAAPGFRVTKLVQGLEHPWDVQPIGGGRLLITERDTAHLIVAEGNSKRRVRFPSGKVWVSGETGLMSMEIDPGFARNRRFYTCQGGFKSRWRPRRPGHRLAAQRGRDPGHDGQDAAQGAAHQQRAARRLPTADHQERRAAGRHRRRRGRHQPAEPRLPGRQDAAAQPDHREAVADQPVHQRQRQAPLRPDLRTPQRPGPRPAPRRHPLVGRARFLPRRRGQQAGGGRQLRLEPGARLQRVGADDRLRAARQAARRPVAVRRPDARDLGRVVRPR